MEARAHRLAALTFALILVLAPTSMAQCPGTSFVPTGLAFDAVCIDSLDLNTGTMACLSPPLRYTVY